MRSIVQCIFEHSQTAPYRTAVIANDLTVDYASFWKMIASAAKLLQKNGIEPGMRVMLEASHTVEFLVLCYGIHLAGGVHVPVEQGIPQQRVAEIAAEIRPALVLTGAHPLSHFGLTPRELPEIANNSAVFPTEDMLQEILFTTGTTGKSKGVMITHGAQMNMCESQNAVLDYGVDNLWLIPSPMNHAAGLRKTHMSMVRGSSVLLMNGFTNLKRFFDCMRKYPVTSLYLPPAGVHYLLTLAPKELARFNGQLDFIYSSSSILPGGDKEKLIELLPDVRMFDAYGGSEVGAVCYIDYNAVRGRDGCVGRPNPGVEIFLADENGQKIEATPENPGVIAIRSNTVAAGYWNEPELTAQTIRDGVIYMSDLGYMKDGYLYLSGRRDDVINTAGFKVAPSEVEEAAMRHPSVNECVCIPYHDPVYGCVVKMLVVLRPGFELDVDKITQFLQERLENYKIPKYIETIEQIPRTFNGKIDRKRIISLYAGSERRRKRDA